MDDQRPNIIFIITDQQRFDTINSLGFDFMDTPHLDRLVREGVSFTGCHVTAASCAPARASLFKGYYPHTTGILKNADRWRESWVELLNSSGYHCTNIGKMHSWPFETPLGFDERYVVENKDRYLEGRYYFDEWDKALRFRGMVKQQREQYRQLPDYKNKLGAFDWNLPEDTHPDNFVGDMACWWLDAHPHTDPKPLFLQIGFPGPHPPYDPVPSYAEPYLNKQLPIMEVTQEELDKQPPPLAELRRHNSGIDHDSVIMPLNPTAEQRHRQRAYYCANVTMIDEKVGQIMESLERNGYLDNSVVIFTSDHGDCLSDHGHSQKWTMYDLITQIPLIVWSPGRYPAGKVVDALCQQMDLGPTILELANVEVPPTLEAISLANAFTDDDWAGRDYLFAEQAKDGILTHADFMTMVRTSTHKLVHFLDEPYGQLFDLQHDPQEVNNLWEVSEYETIKQELLAVLREWRIRSALHTADLFQDHR
ncbi:MAG: sulfatase-like hydrolase/transferase [Pirellulaceae bacterium]|jgi:arylsulfatase|nr:sulfatase-like hydrolase/transferase [Pirellulaceae bacterium]